MGRGQITPEEAKIKAVNDFKRPVRKKDVRAFFGLAGYYWWFIPNFSTTAAPLLDLTKKDGPDRVHWGDEQQEAFDGIKSKLTSDTILRGPNFDNTFIIQTDASEVGIGAVLSQVNDNGEEHPVAYFSRKLLLRERWYATVQKECLAVVDGIRHFRVYVTGVAFLVQTYHKCLVYLDRVKDVNGCLTRWALALQPYQFTIRYRPGTSHNNADGLSRQAWEDPTSTVQEKEGGVSGSSNPGVLQSSLTSIAFEQ